MKPGGSGGFRCAAESDYALPSVDASDEELLEAWRGGDSAAGDRLFQRHFDTIYRFFRTKVRDDVGDLVQATFLGAVESRDRIRAGASVRAYLLGIAHKKLLMHWRARAKSDRLDFSVSSLTALGARPSEAMLEAAEQRLLLRALASIPLELQIVIELYYWQECSGPELAAVLDVPEGTVRSRLRRGLAMLREALEALEDTEDERRSSIHTLEEWAARLRALRE